MGNSRGAIAWAATGAAITAAIWITGSGWWIWFLLLPLFETFITKALEK